MANDPYVCDESVGEVWHRPVLGDMLCFDGKDWRVSRRNGWYYPVEEVKELAHNGTVAPMTVSPNSENTNDQEVQG